MREPTTHHAYLESHVTIIVVADGTMMASSFRNSMKYRICFSLIVDREFSAAAATSYRTSIAYVSRLPFMDRAIRSIGWPCRHAGQDRTPDRGTGKLA